MSTITNKYSPEQINELRSKVDILRKVSIEEILIHEGKDVRHTPSKLYHSPFREDKTPSFHIDEVNHRFSDPGDTDPSHKKPGAKQAGGDTIDLVMWLKGCNYNEALVYLYEMSQPFSLASAANRGDSPFPETTSTALSGYVNHSGGAIGSDTEWGETGAMYGVTSRHYYHGRKTPNGNVEITEEQFQDGVKRVLKANESLGRRNPEKYMDLLARNWQQVANADAVYAVSAIDDKVIVTKDGKGYNPVKGGTGWAVQMAIDAGKPVFVFDQEREEWYGFHGPDIEKNGWALLPGAPALTKNFAGIGSRELSDAGKKAIKAAYYATIANNIKNSEGVADSKFNIDKEYLKQVDSEVTIDINRELSNLAVRHFVVGLNEFNSVEQYIQWQRALRAGETNLAGKILEANTPDEAKRLGQEVKPSADGKTVPEEIGMMDYAVRRSFAANPSAIDLLLQTGNSTLKQENPATAVEKELPGILMKVRHELQQRLVDDSGEYRGNSVIEIRDIRKGVDSPSLVKYESKDRMIDPYVLQKYCCQVKYTVKTQTKEGEKAFTYMAVGFQNRQGDWALRGAPYITRDGKQSNGIKRTTGNDISFITENGDFATGPAEGSTRENLVVFEGFNDFLSWLSWRGNIKPDNANVVVLNSVVNLDRAEDIIKSHKKVFAYMDGDKTGRRATAKIEQMCKDGGVEYNDCSYLYTKKGLNDFNDAWLVEVENRKKNGKPYRITLVVVASGLNRYESKGAEQKQEQPKTGKKLSK